MLPLRRRIRRALLLLPAACLRICWLLMSGRWRGSPQDAGAGADGGSAEGEGPHGGACQTEGPTGNRSRDRMGHIPFGRTNRAIAGGIHLLGGPHKGGIYPLEDQSHERRGHKPVGRTTYRGRILEASANRATGGGICLLGAPITRQEGASTGWADHPEGAYT